MAGTMASIALPVEFVLVLNLGISEVDTKGNDPQEDQASTGAFIRLRMVYM